MEFSFTQDQQDLQKIVRTFLSKRTGSDARRSILTEGRTFDESLWKDMAAQLGLQGIALDEQFGGADAGFTESAIVFEELGRELYSGPYFSTIAATWILAESDVPTAHQTLEAVAAGEARLTVALADVNQTWFRPGNDTRAVATGDTHRVWGSKGLVTNASDATWFVVYAQLPEGAAWFLVPANQVGVTVTELESLDLTRPLAQVTFDDAEATLIIDHNHSHQVLSNLNTKAAVALAAEMIGGAQSALEQAVSWSLERHQFGRPIGSFQSIKHMCADDLVEIEAARVLTHYAAHAVATGQWDAPLVAAMAKQAAGDAYLQTAANNIQIHGGIGFTWEHEAHLWFRNARSSATLFGSSQQQRQLIADLLDI